jgi:hypothetical protein
VTDPTETPVPIPTTALKSVTGLASIVSVKSHMIIYNKLKQSALQNSFPVKTRLNY